MNSKVMHFGSKIFEVNLKRLNTYLMGSKVQYLNV